MGNRCTSRPLASSFSPTPTVPGVAGRSDREAAPAPLPQAPCRGSVPVLAQRILDWRSAHGRFSSVDELGEVSGIGEKLLAQLTPKVTV